MITLVVAPYGEIRDSLTSLISVIPEINIVSTTENLDRGIIFVAEHFPDIVVLVLDDLDSDKLAKVKSMKESSQDLNTVAFLKNTDQVPDCESGIFDAVLPQYARAGTIRKTISTLIK